MIIGQEKICTRIDSSTLDSFPRTLMLVGSRGAGKHLIVDYIATKFSLRVLDITTELNQEAIEELYNRVEPYLYIIRANELSVKEENTILKFLEEPLKNAYIILLAETDIGILQTILNRCQIWYLQNYKREFLKTFVTTTDYVLDIATTPGQVKELCSTAFDAMVELAEKIVDKIHLASVTNTLTISNKIKFKDEKDKFDLKLFVDIVLHKFVERYKTTNDSKYNRGYIMTSELKKKLAVKNVDTRLMFERYLVQLRATMRGEVI